MTKTGEEEQQIQLRRVSSCIFLEKPSRYTRNLTLMQNISSAPNVSLTLESIGKIPNLKWESLSKEVHAVFHGWSAPSVIVGRDTQSAQIASFIRSSLLSSTSQSLYVTGAPGTGKTMLSNSLLSSLAEQPKLRHQKLQALEGKIMIVRQNVMGLKKVSIFESLLHQLKNNQPINVVAIKNPTIGSATNPDNHISDIQEESHAVKRQKRSNNTLPEYSTSPQFETDSIVAISSHQFSAEQSDLLSQAEIDFFSLVCQLGLRGTRVCVLLDEVDSLIESGTSSASLTSNNVAQILQSLFFPPEKTGLVTIAIANTIELVDRILPHLTATQAAPVTVVFPRYLPDQLHHVINQRSNSLVLSIEQWLLKNVSGFSVSHGIVTKHVTFVSSLVRQLQALTQNLHSSASREQALDMQRKFKEFIQKDNIAPVPTSQYQELSNYDWSVVQDEVDHFSIRSITSLHTELDEWVGKMSQANILEESELVSVKTMVTMIQSIVKSFSNFSLGLSNLRGELLIDSKAASLCAKQTSGKSGDARQCLEICRQVLMSTSIGDPTDFSVLSLLSSNIVKVFDFLSVIIGREMRKIFPDTPTVHLNNETGTPTVSVTPDFVALTSQYYQIIASKCQSGLRITRSKSIVDLAKMASVSNQSASSNTSGVILGLPMLQQSLLLVVALSAFKIPGTSPENLTLGQFHKCCGGMLQKLSLPSVASSEFAEVFSALEASGLIHITAPKRSKSTRNLSGHNIDSLLQIKVSYEEVYQALADNFLFKSIFDQIQ